MTVVVLDHLLDARRIWRGRPQARPPSRQPTGFPALDAALPGGGWPEAALSELLLPADGIGELALLWPTLARLSRGGGRIVLVAPPYLPFAAAWASAGVRLEQLQVVRATPRDAAWATEQCLRSAACAAVLCWPQQADDRTLRRLQLAAEAGQCLGLAMRPAAAASHASPAALRLALETHPARLRVLKCRGGHPPAQPLPWPPPTEEMPPDGLHAAATGGLRAAATGGLRAVTADGSCMAATDDLQAPAPASDRHAMHGTLAIATRDAHAAVPDAIRTTALGDLHMAAPGNPRAAAANSLHAATDAARALPPASLRTAATHDPNAAPPASA